MLDNFLSLSFIVYVLAYIVEAFILNWYCHKIFYTKYSRKIGIIVLFCLYIILLIINRRFENPWLNTVLFVAVNFIYIYAIYKLKWYTAIFQVALLTVSMEMGELLAFCITAKSAPMSAHNIPFYNLVVNALLSKLIYIFIINIFLHLKNGKINEGKEYDKIFLILVTIPVISIFIILLLANIFVDGNLSLKSNILISISIILVLILNLIILSIYSYTQKKNNEFTELQIQLQKEYDSTEYYKMLLSQNENQSILIHDIKKHLQSINLLNEQNEREKIAEYIDRIIKSSDLSDSVRVCDNEILNAIISRYSRECQRNNIAFHTDIRKNSINFMQENDITSLFCNLLDNALESASKQRDSFIELNMKKRENTDYTVITMVNTCRINPFSPKTGKLVSSKKDKLRHGYGIKSIERIANSYGGDMQTYFKDGENIFYTIVTLRNMSD